MSNVFAVSNSNIANATVGRDQLDLGNIAQRSVIPPARGTPAGPIQVFHRFEGRTKTDGIFGSGIGARRDNTHQVVQQRVSDGKGGFRWRVTVQPINEGRINPNQHAFEATRPVTRKDFNDTNSRLSQSVRAATVRLNDASNRLPEAPPPRISSKHWMGKPTKSPAEQISTIDWLGQQGKNAVGGATSMVTSTLGMIGSLPEKTGKLVGSVGDIARAGVNIASGGRLATTAFNPMSIDTHSRNYGDVTNSERGMSGVQRGIDKAIGANPDGLIYKTSAVLASFVGAKGKGKGGKAGHGRATVPKPTGELPGTTASRATTTPTTAELTHGGTRQVTKPIKIKATPTAPTVEPVTGSARAASTIRPLKMADGSVRLIQGNGQPATLKELTQAVADGRITTRQLRQAEFSEVSIKGVVRDAGTLRGKEASTRPASASSKVAGEAKISDDMLGDVQRTLNNPEFQKRLARSNSPAEIARQNQAIKDMRANNKLTASQSRPESGGSGEPAPRNEPQLQRQPKTENPAPNETRYADDLATRPQLNVKPRRGEMNLKSGSPTPADPVTATSGGNLASVAFGGVRAGSKALASQGQSANQNFARNLFSSEARLADHYRQRALGDKPGQSPTSHFYGGHAQTGLFAGIGGATHTQVVANVEARVKSLIASGKLAPLTDVGNGSFNRVYVQHSTGQIVRVGLVTSDELSGSNAMSKLQGPGHAAGAQVDLKQSLYAPGTLAPGGRQSEGLGVLVMERVPGQALTRVGASLNAADRAKIAPQLADALVAMHINGRVHADVMERNIMFDPSTGQVRLIDLGMSVRSNREVSIQADLADMANIVHRYGTAGRSQPVPQPNFVALRQAKLLYFQAVDRLPGPNRNAPIYRQHPALYEQHVTQFKARCDALKFKVAASSAASARPQPAPQRSGAP